MKDDRELLEMALEALEEVRDAKILALELKPSYHNIISSLHARLAQPEKQAPYIAVSNDRIKIDPVTGNVSIGTPAAQPDLARVGEVGAWGEPVIDKSAAKRICTQLGWEPKREWQGLTDEEIALICGECAASAHQHDDISFARAIEAKLKERNT